VLPFPYLPVHGALSLGFSAILLSAGGPIARETVSFLFFLLPPPRPRGRTIARNAIDIQRDFTRQQVRPLLAAFYSGVLVRSAVNGTRISGMPMENRSSKRCGKEERRLSEQSRNFLVRPFGGKMYENAPLSSDPIRIFSLFHYSISSSTLAPRSKATASGIVVTSISPHPDTRVYSRET